MTSLMRMAPAVELERHEPRARGWLDVMMPAIELAKAIADTDFVPSRFRGNAAQISAAILYGDEVGIGPMQSLAHIAIIEGRPTLAAETQRALVLAAGHELWPEEMNTTRVTWCGRRSGRDQVTRVTWTKDDATKAKLAGRKAWIEYPRQMLSARASAELVRAIFADVVGGLAAREELEDAIWLGELETETGGRRDNTAGSGARRRRGRPAKVAAAPTLQTVSGDTPPAELPPLPGELDSTSPPPGSSSPAPAMITDTQRRRIMAQFRECGITDRGERLRYAAQVISRKIGSSNELTEREADALAADLERLHGEQVAAAAPAAEEQTELEV